MESTSSSDERLDYLEEFDCGKCGELSYKERNDIRNECISCRNAFLRNERKDRKRKLMETHKTLLENKRLAKQTKKYEKMGDVFHQLSSDSDVSFSGADDVEKDPNYSDVIPPTPQKSTASSNSLVHFEKDDKSVKKGNNKDLDYCDDIPATPQKSTASSNNLVQGKKNYTVKSVKKRKYFGDTDYLPETTFHDGIEMAKEEDRGNYKEEIENRKSEIERKLIDFFGVIDPIKY